MTKKKTKNTLGLWGDGDDSELIEILERSFGQEFKNEPLDWGTVGDIYGTLEAKCGSESEFYRGCTSAGAFRQLRQALVDLGISQQITPKTRLDSISGVSFRSIGRALETKYQLNVPALQLSSIGLVGFAAILLAILAAFAWFVPQTSDLSLGKLSLLLIAAGIVLIATDPLQFGDDTVTVGDWAKKLAGYNVNRFSGGRKLRHGDIWAALTEILASNGQLRKSEIRLDTRLLASQAAS